MSQEKNLFERIPERLADSGNAVSEGMNDCLWSKAGFMPNTVCEAHFDCPNCLIDSVMNRDIGDIDLEPERNTRQSGNFCIHRFYSTCHTWAEVETNGFVRIGLDDFGQNILGPISRIILPERQEAINRNSIRVVARGATIPLTPPVKGYVEDINDTLIKKPQLVNKSPYGRGGLVLLRPADLAADLENLFHGAAALKWFDLEMFKLAALITSVLNSKGGRKYNMTLPDGSLPDFDILNNLPRSLTKRVVEQCFLYCHTDDKFKN